MKQPADKHTKRFRIALIHAIPEARGPILQAFAQSWPEAETFSLLDDSLTRDLATSGGLTVAMTERFLQLGRYAAAAGAGGRLTDAILFTCSAFGPAIEQVKKDLHIPVLNPYEASYEEALKAGRRIGVIATFEPSLAPMVTDLQALADLRRIPITIESRFARGALAELQAGRADEHDAAIAETAASCTNADIILLCQFSMARAAPLVAQRTGCRVLTTPTTAVAKLRRIATSGF
jgi:Asp/Glu/hydantoin racemase